MGEVEPLAELKGAEHEESTRRCSECGRHKDGQLLALPIATQRADSSNHEQRQGDGSAKKGARRGTVPKGRRDGQGGLTKCA